MNGVLFLYSLALHLAWTEGKASGINGILAVMFCLRNRVAANWEEGDLGRVIQGQHFMTLAKKIGQWIPEIPDIREPIFQQAMTYVEGIFDNTTKDNLTSGALYWSCFSTLLYIQS